MELKGKKIAFLGDSITEGVGTSSPDKVYWMQLGAMTGAQVYGYGISGTRIAVNRFPGYDPYVDKNWFGSRVEQMIPDADIVVVFGGTNDFGHGDAPLGTMQDRTNETFYGAYHLLLQKLICRYPNAQLLVMTPLHRVSEDDLPYNEAGIRLEGNLKRYAQIIREVAEFYSIPVVDLFAESGIQPRMELLREKYMPDGLHPNDAGNERIARCLLNKLRIL